MLINRITLTNFLCYYGTDNEFAFAEGLNIVLGANGYGKSKLYDAFQWVFKDGITDNSPNAAPGGIRKTNQVKGDLVSEKAKTDCEVGAFVESRVVIEVEYPRNSHNYVAQKKYQLIRSYRVRKTDDRTWAEPAQSEFALLEFDIVSYKPVPEQKHDEILQRLIPTDVMPYVWFQGERGINRLIDTTSNNALRDVIKHLSDINRWDRYIETTEKAHKTAQNAFDIALRTSEKDRKEILGLQTDRDQLNATIKRLERLISEASQNQQAAKDQQESLLASIEFAEIIQRLTDSRNKAAAAYKAAVKEYDALEAGLSKKLFTDHWVLLGTTSLITRFEEKLSAYDEATATRKANENLTRQLSEKLQIRLPENVPEPMYVRQMLEAEHCKVCDRPAPKGSDAYEAIMSLLVPEKPAVSSADTHRQNLRPVFRQLNNTGLTLQSSIEGVEARVRQSMERLGQARTQIGLLKDELEAKERELREQEQLSSITNARDIINSMRVASGDIEKYGSEITRLKGQQERQENLLKDITDKLNKLSEGQVPEKLRKKKDLLQDLKELAGRVKAHKYQELVSQLEDAANEHYRNINGPTGAFYGKIRFIETGTPDRADGGYRPAIVGADGREVGNLNTSLVSSLKLSIIMAIVSANKTRNYAAFYPLISDAPVSDFDVVKTLTFFQETARTFRQSIVIVKELLVEDPDREGRYMPDYDRLRELQATVTAAGKALTVFQLDMPEGVSTIHRSEIEVRIQNIIC